MPTIEWLESLEIGHPVIDQQHKQILEHLNTIADSVETGDHSAVESSCNALCELLESHFRDEVEILREAGFPRLESHMKAHDLSLERMLDLANGCGRPCRQAPPKECIAEWTSLVLDHILRHDLDFKSFLQETKRL